MIDLQPIESSYREQERPRPHTRAGYHPRTTSTHSNGNFNRHLVKAARNSELPTRNSTTRHSLAENLQYLHVRLLHKHRVQPNKLVPKLQTKLESQHVTLDPQAFVRPRRVKGFSTGRVDQIVSNKTETRPTTSNNEKLAYFADLASGPEVLKTYKVLSHIGKGAFSVVSLAVSKENHKPYAIKTYEKIQSLDWNRLACLKRQIRHLKKLQHPRVIQLVDVVTQRKKLFLILQNGGKHSLGGFIRKQKIISEPKCIELFKQILEGVSYCHNKGVCHRDLKPQNILLDQKGLIKLIDFGFSANSMAALNNYCGTPAYMSPQIVKKQSYIGAKADIWALGVVLYLMVVGTLPFRAPNQQELNRLIITGKYRYREQSSIPLGARRLISRMLQVNPNERPSASDLLEDNWLN